MMPEGPECKRTADELNALCLGWSIAKIDILSGRYVTHGPPAGFEEFTANFLPAVVSQVCCKGKFIYMICSSPSGRRASIWSTLGMSGRWGLIESRHSRVRFTLTPNKVSSAASPAATESEMVLYYTDARNFGTLTFSWDTAELEAKLQSLGPAWLSGDVTKKEFLRLARKGKSRYAAVFLMDQSKTSGVGNYILSEAFYRSWIDPFLRLDQISDHQLMDLHEAISQVIGDSYASFGVSRGFRSVAPPIGMFRGLDNNAGSYGEQLQVYGRDLCARGRRVRKLMGPHKRSIWFCDEQLVPESLANRQALGVTDSVMAAVYLSVSFSRVAAASVLSSGS